MNNSTSSPFNNLTEAVQNDVMSETWLRVLFISLYCVIFALGISGNSLVVCVVVRNRAMQTITNVFITNLAISDIMMCLLAVPFTPISGLLESWLFGEALCRVVPMTLGICVHVSTLTSVAIAIDRYFVIMHPYKPRMKLPVCIALIISIWIVSISVSLPLAVYQKLFWYQEKQIYVCDEDWPHPAARKFFTLATLGLQYIVPCSLIIFCYSRVSVALTRRARSTVVKRGSSRTKTTIERHRKVISRKRRTNRMLIAMVVIFVLCWLPLNVIILILEYGGGLDGWRYLLLTFFAAHVVAMSSTVYNPFLYAWMNDNFQTEFRRVLPCAVSRGRVVRRVTQTGVSVSMYSVVETSFPLQRLMDAKNGNGSYGDRQEQDKEGARQPENNGQNVNGAKEMTVTFANNVEVNN